MMDQEAKIEEIKQRARKNFSLGYNCAECVTEAVLSLVDTGLPQEVKKMATGFGGGVGLFGDTCGAITGAVLAVGAVHGRSSLPEGEGKEAVKKPPSSFTESRAFTDFSIKSRTGWRKIWEHALQRSDIKMERYMALPRACPLLP